jgi:ribonucleotide monophosphatase NagD (HAD superfamily)
MDPRYTIFCDIDGTLCKHEFDVIDGGKDMTLLPGVLEKMRTWKRSGHTIVLTTGRPSIKRGFTVSQLVKFDIPYDHLIMGLSAGKRIVINDKKSDGTVTAFAFSPERNAGIATLSGI